MRLVWGRGLRSSVVYLLFGSALCLAGRDAIAFDFFGLFGSEEKPPAASRDALPYSLAFDVAGGNSGLTQSLKDASGLYKLRQDAPPDGESLARRAAADLAPLLDALWGAGYYNATIAVDVGGVPIVLGRDSTAAAARAAERFRAREAVPIRVKAEPGPLFALRDIRVSEARTGEVLYPGQLRAKVVGLKPGDPARAGDLRAAAASIVDDFRARSHPLAKSVAIRPVVDHVAEVMDVVFVVAPGPVAPFGDVSVSGSGTINPAIVRSFIYLKPGDPYSPQAVADTRKSIARIGALGSIRIREGEALDGEGRLPIFVEVTERKPHLVGFSARYSSVDGPALRAYWEDRNLFGEAELLRLEGELFLAPRNDGTRLQSIKDFEASDLGARFKANFVKPALDGTRFDLLADALAERDRTGGDRFGGYTNRLVRVSTAIRERFSDTFYGQVGIAAEKGQSSDVLGQIDYFLVGTPISVTYDSTDKLLDPSRGIRATASVTPYPTFFGSTVGIVESRATASGYYAIDEDARVILAGRLGLGSIAGAPLDEIPASHRFFAGGGGSVRGYRYASLGPTGPFGFVVGGRSLLEASFEARIKITETIGIVPFVDAGGAFLSTFPDFQEKVFVAAGLGLRYYTAIGPIRLDVAVPLDRRPGDKPVVIYVSVGQAF
jgi:translocation and assembly module TamA